MSEESFYVSYYLQKISAILNKADKIFLIDLINWIEIYSLKVFNFSYKLYNKKCSKNTLINSIKKWVNKINNKKISSFIDGEINNKYNVIINTFSLLKEEKEILKLILFSEKYNSINALFQIFHKNNNYTKILSKIIKIQKNKLKIIINNKNSVLFNALLDVNNNYMEMSNALERIYYAPTNNFENVQELIIGKALQTKLNRYDFKHELNSFDYISSIINKALNKDIKNLNIILHNTSDIDKCKFAIAACNDLGANAHKLIGNTKDADRKNRLAELILAQDICQFDKNTVIIFQDADKVLFTNKLFTHLLLIENPVPVIWLVDDIDNVSEWFLQNSTTVDIKSNDVIDGFNIA